MNTYFTDSERTGSSTPLTVHASTIRRHFLSSSWSQICSVLRDPGPAEENGKERPTGFHLDPERSRKERWGVGGLVSVVIPCYNQAHFLGEAIESVLAQSYTNFEVIVVDDGSEDTTSEVASGYEGVRLIRQENGGLSAARNRGLAEASGEYVVFLDSDDRLLVEALEVGVRELESHPECAFVSGTLRHITVDGAPTWVKPSAYVDDHYVALLRRNYVGTPATVMFRKWVFGETGGFDVSLRACEDYDLYLRIARRFPIYHHGELVAEYRRHGATMSADPALMLRSAVAVLRSKREHVRGNEEYEKAYKDGVEFWQDCYGYPLVCEARDHAKGHERVRVARAIPTLLLYFPQGLTLLSGRGMEEFRLRRELRACTRDLQTHLRRRRDHSRQRRMLGEESGDGEGRLGELGNVMAEERREIRRLRRRSRRLRQRVREIDGRAQNGLTRRILRGLRRVTTKKMARNHGASDYRVGVRLDRQHARSERQGAGGLVSVVIPCYNQAHFLGEAIESVLAQSYTDFELIVVDDGSEDNTPEVASGYEGVRLVRQENRGLAGARNRGLVEASGEYVVFLDSDDRLLAGALEVGVRELEAHPECAFVSGRFRAIDASGAQLAVPARHQVGTDPYLSLLRDNYIKTSASAIYRRWPFGEIGDFDSSVDAAADWDLYLRIARRFPIYHHGELVAEYRRHGATMSADPALMLRSAVAVLRSQREHVRGNEGYEKAYKAGIGALKQQNAVKLAKDLRSHARERQWGKVAREALELVRYYPQGLPLLSEGHQERYRLAEELGNANRAIRARERQNRRLKKRNRRLALEAQSVNWHSAGADGPADVQQRTRFFVVGEMKSGTSWTMWMLDSHPEVFCSGEGCFFGRDQEREEIPVYGDPTPSLRNAFVNFEDLRTWKSFSWNYWGNQRNVEEDLPDLTRLAVDYYMMQGSARSGKRIVGDKSPLHTDYVDEIFELYPDARVIHVFRDGRDVAVTLMHHFWTLAKDTNSAGDRVAIYDLEPEERAKRDAYREDPEGFLASGESIFIEERLQQIARRWSRRVGKASRDGSELFGDSFFQVSYEELLAKPQENMTMIFELLGAQADEEVVRRCVEKNSFESMARRPKGREDSGAFLRKGVAGDWRSVFTDRDLEIYEDVARDTLREFGYLPS